MQRTYFDRAARQAVAALASGHGKMLASNLVEADYARDCLNPQYVQTVGRKSAVHGERYVHSAEVGATSLEVDSIVTCRKCANCLRHRQRLWAARSMAEIAKADRTWFGTLTLSPEHHARIFALACVSSRRRGMDFDGLTHGEQIAARDRIIYPHIQRMLKRVRKNTGAACRTLCVCEAHENGLPHYHLLVHVNSGAIAYRDLDGEWSLGFSKWRLAPDDGAALYLAKYLSKSITTRVRASMDYGTPPNHVLSTKLDAPSSVSPDLRRDLASFTAQVP